MKSTSIHSLNADKGLNLLEKPVYLFLNWVNNLFSYIGVDRRIKFKNFGDLPWRDSWGKTFPSSSPARKTSDLFWKSLPWDEIRNELGGEIHIFDTGCGHGNYSERIDDGGGHLLASYTGVDAKRRPNWEELERKHSNFKFIESNSNDISKLISSQTNLFVTQSAIEHFDDDLSFFKQAKEFTDKANHPVMQIHLFPARATLPLYLFHGLRQYTPRTISKITKLFGDNFQFELYGLGGRRCFWLHFKYFTWPVLITRRFVKPTFDVSEYEPKLRQAVEIDTQTNPRSPLFWALIIEYHP
ncbi:MAG: hypothetical protein AAB780_02195 [Patescibacteria group bacterium]